MGLTEAHVKQLEALTDKLYGKRKDVENAILYLEEVAKAGNSYHSRAIAVEMLAKSQHAYIIANADHQTLLNSLNQIHVEYLQSVIQSMLD